VSARALAACLFVAACGARSSPPVADADADSDTDSDSDSGSGSDTDACAGGGLGSGCEVNADCVPGLSCWGGDPGIAIGTCAPEPWSRGDCDDSGDTICRSGWSCLLQSRCAECIGTCVTPEEESQICACDAGEVFACPLQPH